MNDPSPTRHAAVLPVPLLLLAAAAAFGAVGGGCGPARTAGTRGVAAKDLAVLSIPQLPDEAHVRIDAVRFNDAGKTYPVGKGRDFYLPPGSHTADFDLVARVPDVEGVPMLVKWLIPGEKTVRIPGPKKVPLGAVTAGRAYELGPPTSESFDTFLQDGRVSLVREKAK